VNASDNIGVARLVLYIDGKLFASVNGSTLSTTWRARNGRHTLAATAFDAANNQASVSVGVNMGR
jgi:hypothetical protein